MAVQPRIDPTPRLLALASRQGGVLTTAQTSADGLGRHSVARLVESGTWRRLAPGLYFAAAGRPPWLAWSWAGVLRGGDGALLGGQAAAYVHGLVEKGPREIVVWTRRDVPRESRPPWRFRRQLDGVRRLGGLQPPVISVEDTVLDLGVDCCERELVHLVTRAVQHRLTSPDRLRLRIDERGRVSHGTLLANLLADVAAGAETPLELAYLRDVERAHRLPAGRRQHRDRHTGHLRDVWYKEFRTVVELDGRLGHEGTGRFRDMILDNDAALRGQTTLRFGWHDVRGRPCELAGHVAQVLRRAGWTGTPVRCRRCQR